MLSSVPAVAGFIRPDIDWHAVAPELTLLAVGAVVTLLDIVLLERGRRFTSAMAGIGLLVALIPIVTLAAAGDTREMFGGAFVVDDFALILKAMFIVAAYVVVLLSTNYMAEGDYWENEYYGLLLSSVMGMVLMASARDLITIFVALELLSIPAYLLATWRKADPRSNEAGLKYYLMGVFASAIMLYGMSLLFGIAGDTRLSVISDAVSGTSSEPVITLGIVFIIVGFAFKVSGFPFHTWAPDTYEGAPTPVTAFLAVASKAAGFVALMQLVYAGFPGRDDVYQPVLWILAVGSMTAGNLIALRQDNIVRLMAYSGVSQAGFMLAPLAVAGDVGTDALPAVITYLLIYAAMNLGAFAVIIAVARRTASGEISSYAGLFRYAPGMTVLMSIFMFSLAGIPPLGGWFAKFAVFRAVVEADTGWGYSLAAIAAINSVIALFYYAKVARMMWFEDTPAGANTSALRVPLSLVSALAITAAATLLFGIYPAAITHFTDGTLLALP
ncbi:NADH-quinone oxidoreductase subunit N [Candidatus Poriferisocius sp.]|uniref:NADH-quinone oxidoreductase subunit N n=1 Tax=Candidatus Poriferisocius sp. TaxID=3101276 RepID=UPI003B026218